MVPVIKIKITRSGTITAKQWNLISKAAWLYCGRFWHKHILKKHFTKAGAREYGYQTREAKYIKRKKFKKGHDKPLIYSGMLQREAQRVRDIKSVGKRSKREGRVKIKLHVPSYMYKYNKDYQQPDKAMELQTISEGDATVLAKALDRGLRKELRKPRGKGHKTGITKRK